jgi:hypothetical protein
MEANMTTLSYRIAHWSPRWRSLPTRWFDSIISFIALLFDVFTESRDLERKAHKRHPFAEW